MYGFDLSEEQKALIKTARAFTRVKIIPVETVDEVLREALEPEARAA